MAKNEKKFDVVSNNGVVEYSMCTGKVYVKSKMPFYLAQRIITTGKKVEISDARGYGQEIWVDDTYFFPYKETETDEVSADE